MNALRRLKQRPGYQWVIAVSCFVMVMITLGFCSSTKPLQLSAITGALGIERSLFSINDSCRFVTTAVVNLFFGTLIVKFGARKLIAAGFAALAASMTVYSLAEGVYVFYIGGCLLGLGFSWTSTTMVGYVIGRWCEEHKGTIMLPLIASDLFGEKDFAKILGIFVSVNVAGYAVGAPLTNLVYDITGTYHVGLYALGGLMLLVAILFQLVLNAAKRRHNMCCEANEH